MPPAIIVCPMGKGFAAQPCGLAEQQGVAYAKTVAEAMNLKLDVDNPADREKLRRAVLDLVAGEKCQSKKALPSGVDCYFRPRVNFPSSATRKALSPV